MAIFHLNAKIISRSAGRSATASSAYRAGEKITDERTGLVFDYTRKREVSYRQIFSPSGAPEWATDRKRLWNEAEKAEARKDAQVAREIEVALPIELPKHQQIILLERFVQSEFVKQGMIADVCIHDKPGNPHAHILLTTRTINASGFGQKNRDWNAKEQLEKWREQWAVRANRRLAVAGSRACIDHRTLEAQGINRLPTVHIGTKNFALHGKGLPALTIELNQKIKETNMTEKNKKQHAITGPATAEPAKENKSKPMFVSMPVDTDNHTRKSHWQKLFDRDYVARLNEIFSDYWMSIDRMDTDNGFCLRLNLNCGAVYDYGAQMRCDSGTDEEIEVLIRLAKEKGWSGIHLNGSDDFKEKVFIRAVRTGAFTPEQIVGYTPTPEALALANQADKEHGKTELKHMPAVEQPTETNHQPKKLKL